MIHQKQSCLLDSGTLPLATLYDHRGCMKILLLLSAKTNQVNGSNFESSLPEHYLNIVLVLDCSQVWTIGIGSSLKKGVLKETLIDGHLYRVLLLYLEAWHNWKIEIE